MAMEYEKDYQKPTLVKLEGHDEAHGKPTLVKLEEYFVRKLYSLIERDASNWRFWIKITVVMFIVTAGPAIVLALLSLRRDFGLFE